MLYTWLRLIWAKLRRKQRDEINDETCPSAGSNQQPSDQRYSERYLFNYQKYALAQFICKFGLSIIDQVNNYKIFKSVYLFPTHSYKVTLVI